MHCLILLARELSMTDFHPADSQCKYSSIKSFGDGQQQEIDVQMARTAKSDNPRKKSNNQVGTIWKKANYHMMGQKSAPRSASILPLRPFHHLHSCDGSVVLAFVCKHPSFWVRSFIVCGRARVEMFELNHDWGSKTIMPKGRPA
jgi:hypothetical protein